MSTTNHQDLNSGLPDGAAGAVRNTFSIPDTEPITDQHKRDFVRLSIEMTSVHMAEPEVEVIDQSPLVKGLIHTAYETRPESVAAAAGLTREVFDVLLLRGIAIGIAIGLLTANTPEEPKSSLVVPEVVVPKGGLI